MLKSFKYDKQDQRIIFIYNEISIRIIPKTNFVVLKTQTA